MPVAGVPPPSPPAPGSPLPLSVAIVCKDNERTLGRTLASVAGLAGEIIAVDSGSTDGTLALLEAHGARVIRSAWLGHVWTKQLALEACTRPWTLCLDSDESLESGLAAAVRGALVDPPPGVAGFILNRKVYYKDRPLDHAWQPEWRLRLVARGAARWGGLDPHDKLSLLEPGHGREAKLEGTLRHDSFPTFAAHLKKQAQHSFTMAASLRAEGASGSYWRLVTSPGAAFLKQLIGKGAWRDGPPGWLAAASTAAGALMKHAMLIEMTRTGQESASADDGLPGVEKKNHRNRT